MSPGSGGEWLEKCISDAKNAENHTCFLGFFFDGQRFQKKCTSAIDTA